MPCSDGMDDGRATAREAQVAARAFQERADALAAMLCYVMTRLSRGDTIEQCLRENLLLNGFWRHHQSQDNAEKAHIACTAPAEVRRAIASGIAKLTPQEIAALRLNEHV